MSYCPVEEKEFAWRILKKVEIFLSVFLWLEHGLLKIVSETQIIAAQDQALAVRVIRSAIYGLPVSPLCRVCHTAFENIDHLLSSCTPLAATICTSDDMILLLELFIAFI